MKILKAEQIREADLHCIKTQNISSIQLMERAAEACSTWIQEHFQKKTACHIFCGIGNNGGDGFAISRQLTEAGYSVSTYLVKYAEALSEDCRENYDRVKDTVKVIDSVAKLEALSINEPNALVVDAIFGTGLSREVEGLPAGLIHKLNAVNAFKLSIDIPSGLFSEDNSFNKGAIFAADHCLSFELPKLSFMLPEKGNYVGNFSLLDIGLDKAYLLSQNSNYHYLIPSLVEPLLKTRLKFAYKGNYGHALLISGSLGKMGAAALSARACMRSGLGLLTIESIQEGAVILQTALPEAMIRLNSGSNYIEGNIESNSYTAVGIGPGIGTQESTAISLKLLIQEQNNPMVLDADAINILAENKTWISFLPEGSILTPHIGEFRRLAGPWDSDIECIELQSEMAKKHKLYVVLKGAHTRIACPDGKVYFNSTGNPGMATAGSGDVLTGMILSFLAQSYSAEQAAVLGVYIHGLAGDFASEELGMESVIASDIIENIPNAMQTLTRA